MTDQSNDADINGKFLGTVSSDFIQVSDTLKEGAYQIKARAISDYPLFPICKADLPFSQLLLGKKEVGTMWNYYISTAEEFKQLGFIDTEKFDAFVESYKDPEEFCCLFVVDKEFTNFLYIPYPED
jgi:hypothetical protein